MKDQIRSRLEKLGLKITPQRTAIVEALEGVKYPVSIEQLKKQVTRKSIDLVTFYRNMKKMIRAKIVRKIEFMRGHALYELVDESDHHHLICVNCGRVEDVHNCNVDKMINVAIKKSKNFRIVTGHTLELWGLCKNCITKIT